MTDVGRMMGASHKGEGMNHCSMEKIRNIARNVWGRFCASNQRIDDDLDIEKWAPQLNIANVFVWSNLTAYQSYGIIRYCTHFLSKETGEPKLSFRFTGENYEELHTEFGLYLADFVEWYNKEKGE